MGCEEPPVRAGLRGRGNSTLNTTTPSGFQQLQLGEWSVELQLGYGQAKNAEISSLRATYRLVQAKRPRLCQPRMPHAIATRMSHI